MVFVHESRTPAFLLKNVLRRNFNMTSNIEFGTKNVKNKQEIKYHENFKTLKELNTRHKSFLTSGEHQRELVYCFGAGGYDFNSKEDGGGERIQGVSMYVTNGTLSKTDNYKGILIEKISKKGDNWKPFLDYLKDLPGFICIETQRKGKMVVLEQVYTLDDIISAYCTKPNTRVAGPWFYPEKYDEGDIQCGEGK
jgi:hypothetical protein